MNPMCRKPAALAVAAAGLAWPWLFSVAVAAPPTLDALIPSGGRVGEEIATLTVVGKAEPWPCQVWCSNPGVTFQPGEKAGQYKVSVKKDAATGPALVRLFNGDGASEPRFFVVSGLREIAEDEKVANDNPGQATDVGALPVVINARLEKAQDFDAWRVSLKKGQTLEARIDGYALRSGIDPFLHLYDGKGARLELVSDGPKSLDPRLRHVAGADGDFVVAVMAIDHPASTNVAFSGAPKAAYRLTLSVGQADPKVAGVGDGPAAAADSLPPADGAPMALPIKGWGTLAKPAEADRVKFSAKKGQSIRIEVDAFGQGFPTDPVLAVEKGDGSLIREIDDDKADRDAVMVYAIPADGEYACRVYDRFGRGGAEMRYHLEIKEAKPDFYATADQLGYVVKAGEKGSVKLKIERRDGHAQALVATLTGLPSGVTAAAVKIDAKAAEATVEIAATGEAAAFSGPVRVVVVEEAGDAKLSHPAVFTFQNADSRGAYLIDEVADLWLTVTPKAAPKPETAKDDKKK